eukprot:gene15674-18624_t
MKLKIGIALSVVVLVGCIIGFALPWYQITKKEQKIFVTTIDAVTTYFSWQKYKCVSDGDTIETYNYDDIGIKCGVLVELPKVKQIMSACLSFLAIGAGLALGTALLQLIILLSPKLCRSCVWKILCIGCSMATIAVLFVSFFTLLGLPKAFNDDIPGCDLQNEDDQRWCKKIYGSDDDYKWIPGGGWWATLVATATALCAGIFTLASHR